MTLTNWAGKLIRVQTEVNLTVLQKKWIQTVCSQMFKGDGKRIWYDKSINFLCFANGVSCHVVEHSFADAPIASHLIERMVVYERMELAKVYEQYEKSKHQITSMTPCNRLRWHWDNSLENALETALSNFHALSFKIATRLVI